MERSRLVGIGAFVVLALLASAFIAYYMAFPYVCSTSAPCANTGRNGLWLRYTWYFGQKSNQDMQAMGQLLQGNQIHYAYFHVLDVTPEGNLRYRKLSEGKHLVSEFHKMSPSLKVLAWVSAGDWYPAHGTPLQKPGVIDHMVESANWLVTECGFDGVQWDYEPNPSDSPDFLRLLEATKQAIPKDKMISVATPLFYSGLPITWSAAYFGQVAQRCDQLAIMGYDSTCVFPWSYLDLMSQQVPAVSAAIDKANPHCGLIVGVPTYERNDHPWQRFVEKLNIALIGVRIGCAKAPSTKQYFEGVAPFADYTTSNDEWGVYRRLWLCQIEKE